MDEKILRELLESFEKVVRTCNDNEHRGFSWYSDGLKKEVEDCREIFVNIVLGR